MATVTDGLWQFGGDRGGGRKDRVLDALGEAAKRLPKWSLGRGSKAMLFQPPVVSPSLKYSCGVGESRAGDGTGKAGALRPTRSPLHWPTMGTPEQGSSGSNRACRCLGAGSPGAAGLCSARNQILD